MPKLGTFAVQAEGAAGLDLPRLAVADEVKVRRSERAMGKSQGTICFEVRRHSHLPEDLDDRLGGRVDVAAGLRLRGRSPGLHVGGAELGDRQHCTHRDQQLRTGPIRDQHPIRPNRLHDGRHRPERSGDARGAPARAPRPHGGPGPVGTRGRQARRAQDALLRRVGRRRCRGDRHGATGPARPRRRVPAGDVDDLEHPGRGGATCAAPRRAPARSPRAPCRRRSGGPASGRRRSAPPR